MPLNYVSFDYTKPFGGVVRDPQRTAVLCLPGMLCSPGVYFHSAIAPTTMQLLPMAWMQDSGSYDVSAVADWLLGEMDAAGIGTAFVAAHSASGPAALLASLRAPDRIRGLVLLGTGANMQGHLDGASLLEELRDPACWQDRFFVEFVASCFAGKPPEPLATHLYEYAKSRRRTACVEVLESLFATDLAPDLSNIRTPTIVIHGSRDGSRPLSHAELLANGIAGATLHLVDCGHTPMVEAPKTFELALNELVEMTEQTSPEVPVR